MVAEMCSRGVREARGDVLAQQGLDALGDRQRRKPGVGTVGVDALVFGVGVVVVRNRHRVVDVDGDALKRDPVAPAGEAAHHDCVGVVFVQQCGHLGCGVGEDDWEYLADDFVAGDAAAVEGFCEGRTRVPVVVAERFVTGEEVHTGETPARFVNTVVEAGDSRVVGARTLFVSPDDDAGMTVSDDVETFAAAVGPEPDDVLRAMDERAEETGFPTVGPAVGGWLQQLAGFVDAERVFEFGSGYGYSAYWFARALPDDGEIVLTEIDVEELDDARDNLAAGGFDDIARFELGDAIDIVDDYDGPFDAVLIDNEKDRYAEAFEAVRPKVPVGGVVVADNMTAGPFEFEEIHRLVVEDGASDNDMASGVADYLECVRSDEDFETTLLPLGEGLAVSRRVN